MPTVASYCHLLEGWRLWFLQRVNSVLRVVELLVHTAQLWATDVFSMRHVGRGDHEHGTDVFPPVVSHSAGALLSGWRFGKYVHCATCQFCSWPSCTVSRTMDPHRGPCLGQRTLYSSLQGSDCCGIPHPLGGRRNTSGLCWLLYLGHQLPLPLPHEELLGQLSREPRLLGLVTTKAR